MYKYKYLDVGFIVISTEPNIVRLKSTKNSILKHYHHAPVICAVPKSTPAEDMKELKTICPVYRGKETITSLMNVGMKHADKEWNIFIMEGAWMRANLNKKYGYFHESEKDIFFPIVVDYDIQGKPVKIYDNFWDCSLNGIMIHKKTFKEVGEFTDDEEARLFWAAQAVEAGCKFKPILGAKIC